MSLFRSTSLAFGTPGNLLVIRGQTASNGTGLHGHEATSTAQSIMAALTAGEWQGQDIIGAGSWPVFGIQGHWVGWVHRVVPVTLAYLAGHVRMSAATQQNKAGVAMCYGGVWRHLVHVTACGTWLPGLGTIGTM
jgi:hypothetical protein